ncbi:MAG: hypothetical protein JNK58_11360 [Phycisphaerae bacterium]|nr:hypothetical protein [Phycisphaerae bacterium]
MSDAVTSITLRALEGTPLADPNIRDLVVATANSIGERNNVAVHAIRSDGQAITIDLDAPKLVALGFAAELRRVTDRWYRNKTGRSLWGEPRTSRDDDE